MPAEVQGLVLVRIVGLLEHGDIIHAAFVQIGVFVHVERVNLNADHAEILARQLDRFADVADRRHRAAFAGQHEDFL